MLWKTHNPRQNKFIKKLEPFQNVFVVKNYGMRESDIPWHTSAFNFHEKLELTTRSPFLLLIESKNKIGNFY